eukprot:2626903-Prymnesium_polylepis.1
MDAKLYTPGGMHMLQRIAMKQWAGRMSTTALRPTVGAVTEAALQRHPGSPAQRGPSVAKARLERSGRRSSANL